MRHKCHIPFSFFCLKYATEVPHSLYELTINSIFYIHLRTLICPVRTFLYIPASQYLLCARVFAYTYESLYILCASFYIHLRVLIYAVRKFLYIPASRYLLCAPIFVYTYYYFNAIIFTYSQQIWIGYSYYKIL